MSIYSLFRRNKSSNTCFQMRTGCYTYTPTPGCNPHIKRNQSKLRKMIMFDKYADLGNAANRLYWRTHKKERFWV